MKTFARYSFLLMLSALTICSCGNAEQEQEQKLTTEQAEERPADWLFRQRAFPSGNIDRKAYRRAIQYRDQLLAAQGANTRDLSSAPWQFDGPENVGGRITDVEVISGTPGTILIGAAAGGIFRSTDEGASWEPVFDEMPTLAIGDIALAPNDPAVIYAGTGEANAGGGSIAYDGLGVFRSEDGGDSWESRGLEDVGSIGRVVVDPADPNRVYVAAMGSLFANNSERGVYRTLDGGANWEQVLFLSDSTGAIDLAMHPSDPMTIYAAMWERVRRPDRRQYTGITSGVYKSTDGGSSWQALGNGLPTLASEKGRISLAIAPSNPDRVYAGYVNNAGYLGNMMQSDDGGDNWTAMPMTDMQIVPYDWWFNRLSVSPENEDKLYYIGFNINEYLPEQERWTLTFNGVHVDQHVLWIDPNDSQKMILGNDGGLYFSSDSGINFNKSENLPITQFYTCEVDYQEPHRRYGGTQDNGTNRTLSGSIDDWSRIYGGDGFRVRVDPTDNNNVYATFQYGNIAKSTNGGDSFTGITNGLEGTRRNWYTPYVLNPTNPNQLFLGAERVFSYDDQANIWTAISPDLTNGDGGTDGLVFGTITSLSVSPLDDQLIWVGTDDGNVWVTTNSGANWTSISDGLPERWVTSITADPNDLASAYLTFSGFRFGSNMSHIYKTEDYGASWQNINGNLPDIPVNDLVVHPDNNNLFIATDIGAFYSEDSGSNWTMLGTGLPPVVVTDLTLHLPTGTLVAATFGRSMWSVNVGTEVNVAAPNTIAIEWTVAPNPINESTQVFLNIDDAGHYSLRIFNLQGQQLKTLFEGFLPKGEHRLNPDLAPFPSGSYLLSLETDRGIASKAVIVQ